MPTNVDEDLADAARELTNAARLAAMGAVMARRVRPVGTHEQLAGELQRPGGRAAGMQLS
ncbi:MAG: hypothetical protein M3501_10695 [Actinomycetota bacterium]|nr:hypothetical protein [Actinomycetota bacterium]MDQ3405621.1 hypothetical protein [Actinomycetota bacterium]